MEFFDLAYCKNYIVSEKEYSDHNQIKFLYRAECRLPSEKKLRSHPNRIVYLQWLEKSHKFNEFELCQSSPLF